MYPLKFKPILLSKIWGGNHMRNWYGNVPAELDNIGESWVVSAHAKYPSVVCNGSLEGNELQELLEVYMGDLVGDAVFAVYGDTFPLLVKFIDAADDLSIQVHPNDVQAWEAEQSLGKTEMWYVVEGSEPDAEVISGWNKQLTEDIVRTAVQEGRLMDHLIAHSIAPGDVIPIPAGHVHAIKKGSLVAEIQENSDITYRLYDYDRVDKTGQKRELHLEQSLQVLNYDAGKNAIITPAYQENAATNIARTPYFTTNMLRYDRPIQRDYAPLDSFVIFMCVEGETSIEAPEADEQQQITLRKGEAVLIPASLNDIILTPKGEARVLEVYVEPNLDEE